jgi:hypothetical protein
MLRIARARASTARCRVRFSVGDAGRSTSRTPAFRGAIRRTLQWLADPLAAVAEMARVVIPGGRISLIDTDWSTFAIDIGTTMSPNRFARPCEPSGADRPISEAATWCRQCSWPRSARRGRATHTWSAWNPDESPAPDGCFSMQSLADEVVDAGQLHRRTGMDSCRESARPLVVISSRWLSRCMPS